MTNRDLESTAIQRAANVALRRTCAAFVLDRGRMDLKVVTLSGYGVGIELACRSEYDGQPIRQSREVRAYRHTIPLVEAEVRRTVDEMVRNVALAFRPSRPGSPTGWSIHPAAACIIAAAGTALPNPADPASWLMWEGWEIQLPDGGHIADVVFTGREGVLVLTQARIVDRGGDSVATLRTDGHRLLVTLPGEYPESYAQALAGRRAEALCSVFAADPRGRRALIRWAEILSGHDPRMVVELADRLVPLLASTAGGERWRPATTRTIVGFREDPVLRDYLGHMSIAARYYNRVQAAVRPLAPSITHIGGSSTV